MMIRPPHRDGAFSLDVSVSSFQQRLNDMILCIDTSLISEVHGAASATVLAHGGNVVFALGHDGRIFARQVVVVEPARDIKPRLAHGAEERGVGPYHGEGGAKTDGRVHLCRRREVRES